jgi:hypothetical protein
VKTHRLLTALVLILLSLLAWVYSTDRPGPAYPHGQFGSLVLESGIVIGIAALIAKWARARRG